MDNDTQALFEKNYTKGFPAEGMSEQTVGSASRKSDAFPGNEGPLCLLSTARAQRKAPLRTANPDGIVTKKDIIFSGMCWKTQLIKQQRFLFIKLGRKVGNKRTQLFGDTTVSPKLLFLCKEMNAVCFEA